MNHLLADDLQIFRKKSRTFYDLIKIFLNKIRHEELSNNSR